MSSTNIRSIENHSGIEIAPYIVYCFSRYDLNRGHRYILLPTKGSEWRRSIATHVHHFPVDVSAFHAAITSYRLSWLCVVCIGMIAVDAVRPVQ